MEIHGSILPFSQQGLVKLNDVMTKHYFRAMSHQNEKALLQLIQKQNRIEHLKDMGAQPGKHHSISCNNCSEIGHNMCSCVKPCKICGHTPFRSHLVTSENGKNISLRMQENYFFFFSLISTTQVHIHCIPAPLLHNRFNYC